MGNTCSQCSTHLERCKGYFQQKLEFSEQPRRIGNSNKNTFSQLPQIINSPFKQVNKTQQLKKTDLSHEKNYFMQIQNLRQNKELLIAVQLQQELQQELQQKENQKIFLNNISIHSQSIQVQDQVERQICPICEKQIQESDETFLKCQDVFHMSCMNEYIKFQITNRKTILSCPHENCKKELTEIQVYPVINQQLRKKFQENKTEAYLRKKQNGVIKCFTDNCPFIFQPQEGQQLFECQQCGNQYCLKCQKPNHGQISCSQNIKKYELQEQQEARKIFKNQGWQKCPNCKMYVQKTQGCDHMTCICSYQFCYLCGKDYHPDFSCEGQEEYDLRQMDAYL